MKTATAALEFDSSHAAAPGAGVDNVLDRFGRTVRSWHERSKTRRALAELTPRMLEDVGLSAGAALKEAARPFWRA